MEHLLCLSSIWSSLRSLLLCHTLALRGRCPAVAITAEGLMCLLICQYSSAGCREQCAASILFEHPTPGIQLQLSMCIGCTWAQGSNRSSLRDAWLLPSLLCHPGQGLSHLICQRGRTVSAFKGHRQGQTKTIVGNTF